MREGYFWGDVFYWNTFMFGITLDKRLNARYSSLGLREASTAIAKEQWVEL